MAKRLASAVCQLAADDISCLRQGAKLHGSIYVSGAATFGQRDA
jgi:hypothetical protein